MDTPAVVINPLAGQGSARKAWKWLEPQIRRRFGAIPVHVTQGPGTAWHAARLALNTGARSLICLGGDGTLNEVINAVCSLSSSPADVPIGFIPNGTGCDLVKTVLIPRDVGAALEVLSLGREKRLDIGRITYHPATGDPFQRYFHNVASFGVGGDVVQRVNTSRKRFGPLLAFLWATCSTLLFSKVKAIRLRLDHGPEQVHTVWNLAVANGQYHGGGMRIAPQARINDGLFQVVIIPGLSLQQIVRHLPKLYNGRIVEVPGVIMAQARSVAAESRDDTLLDVDGEQIGRLPVSIEMLPRAVTLIVPSGSSHFQKQTVCFLKRSGQGPG
jgi:YegS/Rv2252/BmrU family lipid kinase